MKKRIFLVFILSVFLSFSVINNVSALTFDDTTNSFNTWKNYDLQGNLNSVINLFDNSEFSSDYVPLLASYNTTTTYFGCVLKSEFSSCFVIFRIYSSTKNPAYLELSNVSQTRTFGFDNNGNLVSDTIYLDTHRLYLNSSNSEHNKLYLSSLFDPRPVYNGVPTSIFDFNSNAVAEFFITDPNNQYFHLFMSNYGKYLKRQDPETYHALFDYLHDYGGDQDSFLNNIFVLNDFLNIDLYDPSQSSDFFNGLWRMRYQLSDTVQNYYKYTSIHNNEPVPTVNPNVNPGVLNPDSTIVNPSVDDTEHITLLKEIIRLLILDINNDYAYNINLENFNNYTVTPFFNDVNNALNGLAGVLGGMLNHLSLIDDLNLKLGDINTNLGDIVSNTSGGSGGDTSINVSLDNISQSLVELGTCNYDFTEFEEYIQTSINNHVKYQNLLTSDNNDVPVIEQMSLYGSVRGTSEDGDLSSYDIAGYIPQYQNEDLTFNIPYISNVNLSNDASNYSLEFDNHTFVIQEDFPVFDSAIKKLRKFLGFILLCWFVVSLRNKLPSIIRGES